MKRIYSIILCGMITIPTCLAQTDSLDIPEPTTTMREVTVKATKVKMFMRGDTIVYNADAFNLERGSMLDALISRLPGVTLNEHGQIKVNGEFVSELLINGREFFKGDPKVALQNLPAYTVDKIKVYRQLPYYSYLLGESTRTQTTSDDPLVMNVRLKHEYNAAWLANMEAGGGKKLIARGEGLYYGRVFALHYNDLRTIGFWASANNLSETNVLSGRGWSTGKPDNGEYTAQNGGFSINGNSLNKQILYAASFGVEHTVRKNASTQSAATFLQSGNNYSRTRSSSESDKMNYRLSGTFTDRAPNFSLRIVPNVNYTHQTTDRSSLSAKFFDEPAEQYRGAAIDSLFKPIGNRMLDSLLVNRRRQLTDERMDLLLAGLSASLNFKAPWTKRVINVRLRSDYNYRKNKQYQKDNIWYADAATDDYFRHTYNNAPNHSYSYEGSVRYPILNKREGWKQLSLYAQYQYRQQYQSARRERYLMDQLAGWNEGRELSLLPSFDALQRCIDIQNSFRTSEFHRQNVLTLQFQYRPSQTYGFSLNLPLMLQRDRGTDERNLNEVRLVRHYWRFQPSANFNIRDWSFDYSFSTTPPTILYLIDVRDDTDPLHVSLGNAALKSEKQHSLNAAYRKMWRPHQASLNASVNYHTCKDAIGNATYYNRQTGGTLSKPENVDGNWDIGGRVEHDRMLDKANRLRFYTKTEAKYVNSVDFFYEGKADEQTTQTVRNTSLEESLKLEYRMNKVTVGGKTEGRWTHAKGNRTSFSTLDYADFNYGIYAQTSVVKDLDLSSDLIMNSRRGYGSAELNEDNLIWNLTAAYTFGKSKNWTAKAIGYDLLRQLSQVRHFINVQGRSETWYSTVPSYAMFTLMYRFDVKPKKH